MTDLIRLLVELKDSTLALLVLIAAAPSVVLLYIYRQEKKTNTALQECINKSIAETAHSLTEIVTLLDILVYGGRGKR